MNKEELLEDLLKTKKIKRGYIPIYTIPVTRLKFKYKAISLNKYKTLKCLGSLNLIYGVHSDRFAIILRLNFKLPKYNKLVRLKVALPQRQLKMMFDKRLEYRDIQGTHVKAGKIKCRYYTKA